MSFLLSSLLLQLMLEADIEIIYRFDLMSRLLTERTISALDKLNFKFWIMKPAPICFHIAPFAIQVNKWGFNELI